MAPDTHPHADAVAAKGKAFATVTAAVATPFNPDLSVDFPSLVQHCKWLLSNGCDGLVLFGTNGEASSLTIAERKQILEALVKAGISAGKILVGTGCCATADTVELTKHATDLNCAGSLIVPPFFYKGITPEGIRRYFGGVVAGVKGKTPAIYLYHIPQVSDVPLGPEVTARLVADNGSAIAGYKDSFGDWKNTEIMLRDFPKLHIYVGAETFLLETLRYGGAGCISGSANVNPRGIRKIVDALNTKDAAAVQAQVTATRKIVEVGPLTQACKYILSHIHKNPQWKVFRPPLHQISEENGQKIVAQVPELLA